MMISEMNFILIFLFALFLGLTFYVIVFLTVRLDIAETNIKKLDGLLLGEMKRVDELEQEVRYDGDDLL